MIAGRGQGREGERKRRGDGRSRDAPLLALRCWNQATTRAKGPGGLWTLEGQGHGFAPRATIKEYS